ncbi:hypothetical protein [Streptomyces sp. MH60]|uniref:hypothetical protein n=1 Tax=Streptomyces sp. MH60 TaxID=1940758 RepID=UPI000CEE1535|nr:hypothetical protein [Streptomyces sp. MH60]PPS80529.1 hypothetical protein BZZ08_05810 [Streptomyces sp. MH60]
MGFEGEVWHVRRAPDAGRVADPESGDIGEILIDDADFPWLSGRFRAGPAYGAVRELFARELALAEADDAEHGARWEAAYAEIERRVRLVSPDGPVAEFLLHIKGDRAWFRWSDDPFGERRAGD